MPDNLAYNICIKYMDQNNLVMDLSDSGLTELPALPDTLETLICDNNELTSLPALPPRLKMLSCSGNKLTSLPPLPVTLQVLICDFNKLSSLPELPSNLESLICNNNQLTSLPVLNGKLSELDCEYNNISVLPMIPSKLIKLNARDNPIVKITNLPNPRLLSDTEIFVDNLNLISAEKYKKFLNETINEHQNRIKNVNQTLAMVKERIDGLNPKMLAKNMEIKLSNKTIVPAGPVNMIADYMSNYKEGGRKTRKNKKNKLSNRKSRNMRKR